MAVNRAASSGGLFTSCGWAHVASRGKFLSRTPGNTNLLITHDLAAKRELSSSMGPPHVFLPFTASLAAHGPASSAALFTNTSSIHHSQLKYNSGQTNPTALTGATSEITFVFALAFFYFAFAKLYLFIGVSHVYFSL